MIAYKNKELYLDSMLQIYLNIYLNHFSTEIKHDFLKPIYKVCISNMWDQN